VPRGNGTRDPRSVEWDPAVRQVLIAAIRASRQRKGVIVWVASPRAQFRSRDPGGRTAEERAFTRAAYYHVFLVPRKLGMRPDYSLKLRWGSQLEPSSHGRRARACQVRLYRYGSGYGHVAAGKVQEWYLEAEATGDTGFQRVRETLPQRQVPPPPKVT
jgi:hypothetical protein